VIQVSIYVVADEVLVKECVNWNFVWHCGHFKYTVCVQTSNQNPKRPFSHQ